MSMNEETQKDISQNIDVKENMKQFILYLIVGAGATLVEWLVFYVLNSYTAMHYMVATSIAFILSTLANWILGKLIMFKSTGNTLKELVQIYLTSVMGLLLNLLIMWIAINQFGITEMIAKIIATGIVFFWNFLIRKLIIYKI